MIVYVESNFVLEIALGQEEAQAAESILALAESGAIRMVIPTFALSEPFTTVNNRGAERAKITGSLQALERELWRSALHQQFSVLHQQFATQLDPVLRTLAEVRRVQVASLEQTMNRLLQAIQLAEFEQATFGQARQYKDTYSFKQPQDAVIYAMILNHIRHQDPAESKCFISRDVKAFGFPVIKAELRQFNCQYITTFDDGLSYIQSALGPGGQP